MKPTRAVLDDTICCAPRCMQSANPASPVPLCSRHVRKVYEFGLSVVAGSWMEASRELAAEDREQPNPVPNTPGISNGYNRDTPGVVYFIRRGKLIKIGWSSKLARRMRELEPDEILHVESGTIRDEHAFQERFAHYRHHGEWFTPGDDLLAYIEKAEAAA